MVFHVEAAHRSVVRGISGREVNGIIFYIILNNLNSLFF